MMDDIFEQTRKFADVAESQSKQLWRLITAVSGRYGLEVGYKSFEQMVDEIISELDKRL